MGSIIEVDVLKYRQEDRRAFIRVPTKFVLILLVNFLKGQLALCIENYTVCKYSYNFDYL